MTSTAITKQFTIEQLVPNTIAKAMASTPDEIHDLSDTELIKLGEITQKDWELRTRLWFLIDVAQKKQMMGHAPLKITYALICDGICSDKYIGRKLKNEYKAAFYCRPMKDFQEETEGLLSIAMVRLKEILMAPIVNKDGTIDKNGAALIVTITKMLADRKFGQAVQRRITSTEKAETPEQVADEIEALEAELAEDD